MKIGKTYFGNFHIIYFRAFCVDLLLYKDCPTSEGSRKKIGSKILGIKKLFLPLKCVFVKDFQSKVTAVMSNQLRLDPRITTMKIIIAYDILTARIERLQPTGLTKNMMRKIVWKMLVVTCMSVLPPTVSISLFC